MTILIKIFLIGLLLQFVLFNFVTYGIGFDNQIIWLWKEIFVVFFSLWFFYLILRKRAFASIVKNKTIFILEIVFVVMIVLSLFVTIFIKKLGIGQYVLAFKYDFFGFFIFFLFYHIGYFQKQEVIEKILAFYMACIKVCLVLALFWYAIIITKPGALKYIGYERNIHEGKVGQRPPAVYYTRESYGYVRLQFLFERPISYGYFLIAFWPLFFVYYLKDKTLYRTYSWRILYSLNIILTFSRAAWGAWIAQLILIGLFVYRKNFKRYFLTILLPLFVVLTGLGVVGYRHIIKREFSNTGHLQLLIKGFHMFVENPLFGKGAGYVGPASYHGGIAFNPENQYIQILVEFGIIIFLMYFAIFLYLNLIGAYEFIKIKDKKALDDRFWYLLALGIGMMGISIEGLALHSFVDRMTVYPYALIYGLILAGYFFGEKASD